MNEEVFSGIKVLVAVAQADGCFDGRERAAIEDALQGAALPAGVTVEDLIGGNVDLAAALGHIVSADARTRTYRAACAVAHADGGVSREEGVMCSRIAAELGISTLGAHGDRASAKTLVAVYSDLRAG